jgi:N-acetyl-gamma-glutamyl-phosphate reductase common form
MSVRVGVVGATGYVGGEAARWLLAHPEVELAAVVSRSQSGRRLDRVMPGLAGLTDLEIESFDAQRLSELDAVLLATPHGTSGTLAQELDAAGCPLIIDCAADHRHASGWTYGAPEWNAVALKSSRRIAAPGCFATAIALALAPFVRAGVIEGTVSVAAATGSTGSGASPKAATHHPERFTNLKAYKILDHQHVPEIQSFLGTLGTPPEIAFVPVSAPVDRGILATCFVPCSATVDATALLEEAYSDRPLIRLREHSPELRLVRGTAFADIAAFRQGGTVAVICAIDNLGRGAASQAVQSLELALDLHGPSPLLAAPILP